MTNNNGISFTINCSICNKKIEDNENMFNPIGDKNWYCVECWHHRNMKIWINNLKKEGF